MAFQQEEWTATERQLIEKCAHLEQSLSSSIKELEEAHLMQSETRQKLDHTLKEQYEWKSRAEASNVQFKEERARLELSLSNLSTELEGAHRLQSELQQDLDRSLKELFEWKSKSEACGTQFKEERAQFELSIINLSDELKESRRLQSDLEKKIAGLQQETSERESKTEELQVRVQQLEDTIKHQVSLSYYFS